MKIYKPYSSLTYYPSYTQKSSNLDYNQALNRYCVDLKYVPTYNNYPIKLDYHINLSTYVLPETDRAYYIGDTVEKLYLPINASPNSIVTLVNESGWNLQIFSTCNDLNIDIENFTFLELIFCGGSWEISKKGLWNQIQSEKLLYVISTTSSASNNTQYNPNIWGYGYFNFADIYELYSLGLTPTEIDRYTRYTNNTLTYLSPIQITGPIPSALNILTNASTEYPNFEVYSVLHEDTDVSLTIPERLRLKFSSYLKFEMPLISGMLRDIKIKLINTSVNHIDSVHTLNNTDVLYEVYNLTSSKKMQEHFDYVIDNTGSVIPTIPGGIFHNDELIIKFWR